MKKLIFVTLLLISILPMLASLAFDELVPLYEYANYSLGTQSTVCPNGNKVLLFLQSKKGIRNTYMQIYSPENQALLTEPILIGHRLYGQFSLVANPDNSIAVGGYSLGDDNKYILNTYDQTGNLIPERSSIIVYQGFCWSSNPRSLTSDGLGGLHFSAQGYYDEYYYQHIDALGNLAHSVYGLMIAGFHQSSFQVMATEDHGALFCIPTRPTAVHDLGSIRFVKISPEHQVDIGFTIPGLVQRPRQLALMNADLNSFYAVWETEEHAMFANRISYTGECLWTQDWAPTEVLPKYLDNILVNSEGKLIVHYNVRSEQSTFTSYFDVINPMGSTIHSQLTGILPPDLYYSDYHKYPVADDAGGWFLVCLSDHYGANPQSFVQHFTHDFISWSSIVPLADGIFYSGSSTLSAQLHGGNLQILDVKHQGNRYGFFAQTVDSQANLSYPVPGACLQLAITDDAYGIKSIALPGGACFSMWRQGLHPYLYPHMLKYNIVSPEGTSLFPTAQCFLAPATGVIDFDCFPVGDSQVLIAWAMRAGNNFISRAQLMDLSGASLWEPEGRLLYTGPGQPIFSMQNEALYMARSTNTEIRLHRYVNGTASWQPEGILAAMQNPGYSGNLILVEALTGNRLFWSQNEHEGFPEMSFMNSIDAEGNLQYLVEGLPLANLGSDYFGLKPSYYHWQGDTQICVLAYYYRVWEYDGGHSSAPSWHYYSQYKFQTINPDGSLGPAPSAEQDVPVSVNGFVEDAYYAASGPNIQKYNLAGNLLWSVPFNHDSSLSKICPLPDGRVLLVSRKFDDLINEHLCYYSLLNSDGNIEIPADTWWGTGDISALISTDLGAYLVLTHYRQPDQSQFSGVQYYAVNPINNDDPHVSPPVQLISQNYPNPFKEQTRICLKLDESAPATLKVYNIRGQIVKTLCNTDMPKGESYLDWDGKDEKGKACASGVYILRAQANKKSKTIKILKIQ